MTAYSEVISTHEDTPGVLKRSSLQAYRYVWFDEGWRSDDDPEWTGAGSEAPIEHVGDNTLHGGGIEIDYADIGTTSVTFDATGFALDEICRVHVPTLLRPVYLIADVAVAPVTTTSALNVALITESGFNQALPIAVAAKTRVAYASRPPTRTTPASSPRCRPTTRSRTSPPSGRSVTGSGSGTRSATS